MQRTRAGYRVMAGREEKKEERDLVSVRRGMCKGEKVETGRGGESTQGRMNTHT